MALLLKAALYMYLTSMIISVKACNAPPFTWCENNELAEKCGVKTACSTYKMNTWNKHIQFTLLYETMCPDCQNFITQQLKSSFWKVASDFVDLEFVPYGNAHIVPDGKGRTKVECQHGAIECSLNRLHACAIKHLNYDQNRWYPFIYCIENAVSKGVHPGKATKLCLNSPKIKKQEMVRIMQCHNSSEAYDLERRMAKRTDGIRPEKHTFVPWIIVNNISTENTQDYQQNIVQFLCSWFNGDHKPLACSYTTQKEMIHCMKASLFK